MDNFKEQFRALIEEAAQSDLNESQRSDLIEYVEGLLTELSDPIDPRDLTIAAIIQELRRTVGPTAMAPGEKLVFNRQGTFEEMTEENTVSVDSFLYMDEDDVDDLVDAGQLTRNYCKNCMSHNTAPLNFISHSASAAELKRMYSMLGDLDGQVVVDVGSRLGAALYVGHIWSNAKQLIGIEMNDFFCQVQTDFIQQFGLGDRCSIVPGDVLDHGSLLATADVVVFFNVFDFFSPKSQHEAIWKFVRDSITRHGQRIVSTPALKGVDGWLEDITEEHTCACGHCDDDDDAEWGMHVYRVLHSH